MYGKLYGIYPLGFRRALKPGERKIDRNADERVTEEYVQWQQLRASVDSWDTYVPAIDLAISLFEDFKRWLIDQQDNPELSPHAWAFLEDTVRFINTGTRCVNVFTAMSLMQMDLAEGRKLPLSSRKVKLASLVNCSNDLVIAQWLRHPSGFSDMICSLTAFFGDTQPTGCVTLTA